MYEEFYGLSASPFQLNPDPRFLYGSKGHRGAYACLRQGAFQADGFIVVTGEVGAGKTTLVRVLFEELDPEKILAVHLVTTQLDRDELVRAVALGFGLPVKEDDGAASAGDALVARIEAFLVGAALDGKRALLVVDEAQNLTAGGVEALLSLAQFHSGHHALLHCLLVGQPELRGMLREARMQALAKRVDASYHLAPLDDRETGLYIEHRLAHVGWKGDPIFDPEASQLIHKVTKGIPRRINTLCNRILLAGYLEEKHRIRADDVAAVVAELQAGIDDDTVVTPVPTARPTDKPAPPRPAARQASAPHEMAALNAQLDRLERNVDTMLSMVRSVPQGRLRREAPRRNGMPATPWRPAAPRR